MIGPVDGLRRVRRGLRRRLAAVVRGVARQRRRALPRAERACISAFAGAARRDVPVAPSISVVTVAPDVIAPGWLAALAALEPAPLEVLVVGRVEAGGGADGSTPGGLRIRSIESAAGVSAALTAAEGELTLLLDPSTRLVVDGSLADLAAVLADGPVAAGPVLVHARGRGPVRRGQAWTDLSVASAGIGLVRAAGMPWPRHRLAGTSRAAPLTPGRPVPVAALSRRCLLARTEDLRRALDGTDTTAGDLGPGVEPLGDLDLALRLLEANPSADGPVCAPWIAALTEVRPPAVARPPARPADDQARAAMLDRWGPALYRWALAAALDGSEGAVAEPLVVAIAGGQAHQAAWTNALHGLPWRIITPPSDWSPASTLPPPRDHVRWLADADVVIGDGSFEWRGAPGGPIRIAALDPIDDRAPDPDRLDEADHVLVVDDATADALRSTTVSPVTVLDPTATGAGEAVRNILETWLDAPRVAVRIGAGNWPNAPRWGDLHFGRALQRAFQAAGWRARVRLHRTWSSIDAARDDATVHLFGKLPAANRSAQVDVLWQISHPDLATPELLAGYDRVYVASAPFSARVHELTDRPVATLLQATDPVRFAPPDPPSPPGPDLLYVANQRADRPIVDWLLPTEHDLAVVGQGWEGTEAVQPYWRGGRIENRDLAAAYAGAAIVLNDSWDDMRREGFIPNRVFDALAAGGFVLSDDVVGIGEVFGDAVPVYRDGVELRVAVERWLADPASRAERAARGRAIVLAGHTFDHRAARLIEDITAMLLARGSSAGVEPGLGYDTRRPRPSRRPAPAVVRMPQDPVTT